MVTTGFRNIYVAKYSNTGSTVSYTGFQKLARARGFSLDVGTSDDNSYYADDTLAETESGVFSYPDFVVTRITPFAPFAP